MPALPPESPHSDTLEKRSGGIGSGTQQAVDQKWLKSIFPSVNFIFSHYEIWVGGGGVSRGHGFGLVPLVAPIGLPPLHTPTLCGLWNVFWSCQRSPWMTCPFGLLRGRLSQRRGVARAVDQVHPDAHSESMLGLPAPALTCTRGCVHQQDNFPERGFWGGGPGGTPPPPTVVSRSTTSRQKQHL